MRPPVRFAARCIATVAVESLALRRSTNDLHSVIPCHLKTRSLLAKLSMYESTWGAHVEKSEANKFDAIL